MSKKTLYKGCNLINGRDNEVTENAWFVVEGKNLVKVGSGDNFEEYKDLEVVDLTGKTVMPGLINSHVHITMEPIGDSFGLMSRESDARQLLEV